MDAVIGFGHPGRGGIYWYRFPHTGSPYDRWDKFPIIATGQAYEDLKPWDVDGDGKLDLVTDQKIFFQNSPDSWLARSYARASSGVAMLDIGAGRGAIHIVGMGTYPYPIAWFENPREQGGNARTDPWLVHVVGPGYDLLGTGAAYATASSGRDLRLKDELTLGAWTANFLSLNPVSLGVKLSHASAV